MFRSKDSEMQTAAPIAEESDITPVAKKPKKKKKFPWVTFLFYTFYILLIVAFIIGLRYGLKKLNAWLTDFEASQPDKKTQEVFDDLFADPDWGEIYTLAGMEDTEFEDSRAFIAYMEELVADQALTYRETSAGLSGNKKYIVRAGEETVAVYTLANAVEDKDQIAQWYLLEVETFYTKNEGVTVHVPDGATVSINGIPLDDSYIVRTTSTLVESYLSDGLTGARSVTYAIDGLLYPPQVSAVGKDGAAIPLVYDEVTCTYSHTLEDPAAVYTEEEAAAVLLAAEAYCRYMIEDINSTTLRKYFDPNSEIYNSIRVTNPWMQDHRKHAFGTEEISQFYRYSDTLFSARVTLTLDVTRTNGTVKEYSMDTHFFMELQNGKWMATNMTNVDIQQVLTQVRLTYICDGEVLSTGMVDAGADTLTPPAVTTPEGKVLAGWYQQTIDDKGNISYTLAFRPDENGTVEFPVNNELEPMTLYALFEKQEVQ